MFENFWLDNIIKGDCIELGRVKNRGLGNKVGEGEVEMGRKRSLRVISKVGESRLKS